MSDGPNRSHPHRSFARVGLAACGDSQPSASDWAADVSGICEEINATRTEAVAKHLPSDTAPTRDQLMAFFADFGPGFRAGDTAAGQRLVQISTDLGLNTCVGETAEDA